MQSTTEDLGVEELQAGFHVTLVPGAGQISTLYDVQTVGRSFFRIRNIKVKQK